MGKYSLTFFIFILLFFSSCGINGPVFEVLDGNAKFSRGDYTGATISYMKALEQNRYENWIHYNLGNAYSALGELDPAISELILGARENDLELAFRSNFNLGIFYYELGDYSRAIYYFKGALRADGKDIDAKINLELALKRFKSTSEVDKSSVSFPENGIDESREDILKEIQQSEETVWKQLNKTVPEQDTEDW